MIFRSCRRPALDRAAWETQIRDVFGDAAEGIIALEDRTQKNDMQARNQRLQTIEKNLKEILWAIRHDLPPVEEVENLHRYTLLQLLWDLGLSEDFADRLISYSPQGLSGTRASAGAAAMDYTIAASDPAAMDCAAASAGAAAKAHTAAAAGDPGKAEYSPLSTYSAPILVEKEEDIRRSGKRSVASCGHARDHLPEQPPLSFHEALPAPAGGDRTELLLFYQQFHQAIRRTTWSSWPAWGFLPAQRIRWSC